MSFFHCHAKFEEGFYTQCCIKQVFISGSIIWFSALDLLRCTEHLYLLPLYFVDCGCFCLFLFLFHFFSFLLSSLPPTGNSHVQWTVKEKNAYPHSQKHAWPFTHTSAHADCTDRKVIIMHEKAAPCTHIDVITMHLRNAYHGWIESSASEFLLMSIKDGFYGSCFPHLLSLNIFLRAFTFAVMTFGRHSAQNVAH